MTAPADLHTTVLDQLRTIGSVTVYDGKVADRPPADNNGRVYPYAVLWPNPGWTPGEARGLDYDAQGGLTWDARVTVAAGTTTWALQALHLVRTALDGHRATPFSVLSEMEGAVELLEDPDTSPPRWYVPLTFRTTV